MLISYHNHTDMSDGAGALADMIACARSLGVDELGISDHLTWYPDLQQYPEAVWSMPLDFVNEYVRRLKAAADEQAAPPVLRAGIEADFFPENAARVKAALDALPFDYIIASVHFIGTFSVDARAEDWGALDERRRNEVWRRYWLLAAQCAESRLGDFIGHLDLPKKFGYRPSSDLTKEEQEALEAIAGAGSAIEINTAGWRNAASEAYPAPQLLRAAHQRGIPMLINADAHSPADLIRDFDRARALAREAGYREAVRFERRRMIPYAL